MTLVDEPLAEALEPGLEAGSGAPVDGPDAPAEAQPEPEIEVEDVGPLLRPLAVAALVTAGAGSMTGGVFGEWSARAIAAAAAVGGVGWALVCVRARRRTLLQLLFGPVAFVVGLLSLLTSRGGPSQIFTLMGEAVRSGRLLRPPVPFDPGWRPILVLLLGGLGFATGWIAAGGKRPQLALVLPLPLLGLTAISQPAEGELLAALLGFLPVLAALALLFGGDGRVSELGRAFEIKRALRTAPLVGIGLVALVLLSQTDFLFPKPSFNPADKPQKPKSIPLGEVRDRVLFTIEGEHTGPWRAGVLDVYDGRAWRLPPFDPKRLKPIPDDGVVDSTRLGEKTIRFTVGDLGTSSVLPGVASPTSIRVSGEGIVYDPRAGLARLKQGRVEPGLTYEMALQAKPDAKQLRAAALARDVDPDFTYIPKAPPAVQQLLDEAPGNPWDRLQFLRDRLNAVVIAAGAGTPSKDVPPEKVDDLLVGSHEGSPFEIVAAEAMLARWAGLPARIGYGFDGINEEDGKKTVRPKNGSNWLEAYIEGYGWVPLIGTPPKAKSSLNPDQNTKFDPTIEPSDDVAVELLIPVELENLRLLYQRIRRVLVLASPFLAAALAAYLAAPAVRRTLRRRKRRRWAGARGAQHEIAVEYCELRDAAMDLNVGDPHDTPLEYLDRVISDDEHAELAWLVTRCTYGDLVGHATAEDADAAYEMAASLRRRMSKAQPLQSRVLAVLSRASLQQPYTLEVPNTSRLRPHLRRRRPTTAASRRRTRRRIPIGRRP